MANEDNQAAKVDFDPTNLRPGVFGNHVPVHAPGINPQYDPIDSDLTWDQVVKHVRDAETKGDGIDPSKMFPATALVYKSWKGFPKLGSWAFQQSLNLSTTPVELVHVKAKVLTYNPYIPDDAEYNTTERS